MAGNQGSFLKIKGISFKQRLYIYHRTRTLNKTEKVEFFLKVQKEIFKNHMDAPERKSYAQVMMWTVAEIEAKSIKYLQLLARI